MALICDICRVRPAEARISFVNQGQAKTIDICGIDYQKLQHSNPLGVILPNSEEVAPAEPEPQFSASLEDVLSGAAKWAVEFQSAAVLPEHVLLSLLDQDDIIALLTQLAIKPEDIAGYLRANSIRGEKEVKMPRVSSEVRAAIGQAFHISQEMEAAEAGPEHLFVALLKSEGLVGDLFRRYGLTPERVRQVLVTEGEAQKTPAGTPLLEKYSRNISQLAKEHKLDPVIGRDKEVTSLIEVLSRRTKNNPVLIGEPGVGKTAIVEGLAQLIEADKVPDTLAGKEILELSLNSLVAGTRYRGEFEERTKGVLEEIRQHQDKLIIFIDELHTVTGAGGGEGGLDAANIIKPALARGEVHLIGATTLQEYQKYIEKDSALERRFQPIMVAEPSAEDALAIMKGLKPHYESFHQVKISDETLASAVTLADRYVTNRFLPDKAIDLIDQAAAKVHIAKAEEVQPADIAHIVATITGVPVTEVTKAEQEKLLQLENILHERVIGQDKAVSAVSGAIRVARAGLTEQHTPIATFLFLGPTGVGKTELAKALAGTMFGSEEAIIRLDMSEYMERHAVSRLIGSPPGYVGHDEGGQLTEAVRRRPYSIVLLDEIEKAHPDVYNILLQLLDDGRLTDGKGRVVDFSNTIIIATSNIGSGQFESKAEIGFRSDKGSDQKGQEKVLEALKEHFRPEFLNRIDEVIVFEALTEHEIKQIVHLQLTSVAQRLGEQGIKGTFDSSLVNHLAKAGFSRQYGARELKRKLKTEVEQLLAKAILEGRLSKGQKAHLKYQSKKGVFIQSAR